MRFSVAEAIDALCIHHSISRQSTHSLPKTKTPKQHRQLLLPTRLFPPSQKKRLVSASTKVSRIFRLSKLPPYSQTAPAELALLLSGCCVFIETSISRRQYRGLLFIYLSYLRYQPPRSHFLHLYSKLHIYIGR